MHYPSRVHKLQNFRLQDEKKSMAKKLTNNNYTCKLRGDGIRPAKQCLRGTIREEMKLAEQSRTPKHLPWDIGAQSQQQGKL